MRTTNKNTTEWEAELAIAEEYWFQLSVAVRSKYTGKVVALLHNRILGVDVTVKALRKRIAIQYPDQPVLYIDADAEQEPSLVVLSPHLRISDSV